MKRCFTHWRSSASLFALACACPAQTRRPRWPRCPRQAPTQAPPTDAAPVQPTGGDDKESIENGKKWLELLDAGNSGAAWDVASKQLQSVVKRDAFVTEMSDVAQAARQARLADRGQVRARA